MPDTTLSEALKEAYASAPSDVVLLHTLELRHPSFVDEQGNQRQDYDCADDGWSDRYRRRRFDDRGRPDQVCLHSGRNDRFDSGNPEQDHADAGPDVSHRGLLAAGGQKGLERQ